MDLNVIVYENEYANIKIIENKINRAFKDGFKKIALSVVINGNDVQNVPMPITIKTESACGRILHRLTVKVNELVQFYQLSKQTNVKYYQLLAIEPMNEKILNYLNNGNFDCDLMSFTFSDSTLVNALKKANFSLPISKGIGIEINYADCLSSSSKRRQAIACGQMLVDKTNAKNIILSSGASTLMYSKSPRDVIFIGLLFGLDECQSMKAIFKNGVNVIKHSELRKNIVSSAIEMYDDNALDKSEKGEKRLTEDNGEQEQVKRLKS